MGLFNKPWVAAKSTSFGPPLVQCVTTPRCARVGSLTISRKIPPGKDYRSMATLPRPGRGGVSIVRSLAPTHPPCLASCALRATISHAISLQPARSWPDGRRGQRSRRALPLAHAAAPTWPAIACGARQEDEASARARVVDRAWPPTDAGLATGAWLVAAWWLDTALALVPAPVLDAAAAVTSLVTRSWSRLAYQYTDPTPGSSVPDGYEPSAGVWRRARLRRNGRGQVTPLEFVHVVSRSITPPWGSMRFRLALRTYAPCGPSVRVVSQTKSRKRPTRNILPLFFASRPPSSNGGSGSLGCTWTH